MLASPVVASTVFRTGLRDRFGALADGGEESVAIASPTISDLMAGDAVATFLRLRAGVIGPSSMSGVWEALSSVAEGVA